MTYLEAVMTFHFAFHKNPVEAKQRIYRSLAFLEDMRRRNA